MRKRFLLFGLVCVLFNNVNALATDLIENNSGLAVDTPCSPLLGTGDGKDGAGISLSNIIAGNYTLDGNGNFNSTGNVILIIGGTGNNVLNFNNFTLNAGHLFTVNDIIPQGPLYIRCTGKATIAGTVDLSGKTGGNGNANGCICGTVIQGGTAGLGASCGGVSGGTGGTGRYNPVLINNGTNGLSYGSFAGGGVGGKKQNTAGLGGGGGGGGGGAYGTAGVNGGKGTNGSFGATGGSGGAAGSVYGDANLTTIELGTNLLGGSGGGGGASAAGNPDVTTGGGGGGGGGAVQLNAQAIEFTGGVLSVAGGNGGTGGAGCPGCSAHTDAYAAGGGGGGGSGGTISVQYVDSCIGCTVGAGINISGGSGGAGGSFSSTTGGAGGAGGNGRYLLTQICNLTTAVIEKKSTDNGTVYPNPFSESVTFTFRSEQNNSELKLSDVTGREMKSIRFSGKQLTMNRENIPAGVYIYKTIIENKVTGFGKIIIL